VTEQPKTGTLGGTIVLIVLGLLVLIPSGICTGVFGLTGLDMMNKPDPQGYGGFFLIAAPIVGGPFIIAGAAMLWIGIRRWRNR
jgi:hypothetical protein